MHDRIRRITLLGMMTAVALILSYIEGLLPWFPSLPGVKIGLSNFVVLLILYRGSTVSAGAVMLAKSLLSSLLFASPLSVVYSLAGGILSFAVMVLLVRTDLFSSVGVSAAGGAFHNLGQLLAARLIMGSEAVFAYFPHLFFFGTLFGALLGAALTPLLLKFRDSAPTPPATPEETAEEDN